jgi:hypothetical protein
MASGECSRRLTDVDGIDILDLYNESYSTVTVWSTYLVSVDFIIATVSFDGWFTSRKVSDELMGFFEGARTHCSHLMDYIMHIASSRKMQGSS